MLEPSAIDKSAILFQPIKINKLNISNRIVLGACLVPRAAADWAPSEQTCAFYIEQAKGGVGLIIAGGSIGAKRGVDEAPMGPLLRLDRDELIPAYSRMVDRVHALGTPIIMQVGPSFGRMGSPKRKGDLISASPVNVVIPVDRFPRGVYVPGGVVTKTPREATIAEIEELEDATVAGAVRMRRAGFDGVELPAIMSYFLASFLSPRTNLRTDMYGGSVENRARMLVNIVRKIREKVGPDFPLGLKITCNEHVPGGQDAHGYAAIAKLVEQEGLDYVALQDGCYESMDVGAPLEDGAVVQHGEAQIFKKELKVPIMIPSFHNPVAAAEAIANGYGDLIVLVRPLLADPNYVNKVKEGRPDTIVKCTRDHSCMRRMFLSMPVRCDVNPRLGREDRRPGQLPPLKRILAAPFEKVVMGVTGSPTIMHALGKVVKYKH